MKTLLKTVAIVFIAGGLVSPIKLSAQTGFDRVYARLAGGLTYMEDTELKEFFGPVAPGSKIKFDVGTSLLTTVGYKLTDWSSVEFDFGTTQNAIRRMTGITTHQADLSTIPLMLNGKLRWPNSTRFTPYIGAGVGGSVTLLSADRLDVPGLRARGTASDLVFGYQAMAGVRWALNQKLGLSLEYRYNGMESSDYRMPDINSPGGRTSDHLRLGRLETHTVGVALDANF